MRAVQIEEFGGPEVLQVVDLAKPEPGDGEVLIDVSCAGINFADTHQRENSYLARYEVPMVLGGEVAGTTPDGRRVVALLRQGGYAEYAVAPEQTVFPIPDGVEDGVALALIIQGLTAWHLYRTSAKLQEGESVVVISGAGGVGNLAVQLGKPFGAGRVIATASSEEKRAKALELGADAAVDPATEDLKGALLEASSSRRWARPTGSPRSARRTRTSRAGAPRASFFWTRPASVRGRVTKFADLGLSESTLEALTHLGYTTPTPIQEQAIPSMMEGKDVIGQAQTGTGKTAAFGLPMVEYADPDDPSVQALVLTPTRELCIQVTQALRAYGDQKGLNVVAVFGGAPIRDQAVRLKDAQIVVGTVGRVMDMIGRHHLFLDNV